MGCYFSHDFGSIFSLMRDFETRRWHCFLFVSLSLSLYTFSFSLFPSWGRGRFKMWYNTRGKGLANDEARAIVPHVDGFILVQMLFASLCLGLERQEAIHETLESFDRIEQVGRWWDADHFPYVITHKKWNGWICNILLSYFVERYSSTEFFFPLHRLCSAQLGKNVEQSYNMNNIWLSTYVDVLLIMHHESLCSNFNDLSRACAFHNKNRQDQVVWCTKASKSINHWKLV